MGTKAIARIKIMKKTVQPLSEPTIDDIMESFLPDWLPTDLLNFTYLPQEYSKFVMLGEALDKAGIKMLHKQKQPESSNRNDKELNFYKVSEKVMKQLRLMNFSNRDIQMQNSVLNFEPDEADNGYKAFTMRGEDSVGISLLVKKDRNPGYQKSLMSGAIHSKQNLISVSKQYTSPEGIRFLNTILYLAKRSLDNGNN